MSDTPPVIEIIAPEIADQLAEVFAAMSDPMRLRMISALSHHELGVGELAQLVNLSESATSHHLRLLRTLRIVKARKHGRQVFYSLDDQHIHDLLDRAVEHIEHE